MDAAAIALARANPKNDAAADKFVNARILTMLPNGGEDPMLHLGRFNATKIAKGYRVAATAAYMDTALLQIVGIRTMPFDLSMEVATTSGKYEIALALDNTGSMAEHNKIGALRQASDHLVDKLYSEDGAEDRVKMALIPFTTTVNIRGEAFKPEWLDPSGLGIGVHRFDSYDREVSRLDIFDALGEGKKGGDGLPAAWKGCVEARDGALDMDDTAPGDDPATRWTPYLSPDGADAGTGPGYARSNSYLADGTGGKGTALERMRNVDKYFTPIVAASFDLFDETSGPNQSCRGPIVELTNNRDRMRDAIKAMQPGGFTHIPQGLVWGWRVLSPEEPFSQGAKYEDTETQKILVLLSDGKNTVTDTNYTSYGYLADRRLGASAAQAKHQLDENVTAVCDKVKAKGIRLYMILLEENDAATKQIFEDCASRNDKGEALYYEVPQASQLDAAFQDIGKDLTTLRVTR
jgi:Mg-chelatase subunit ChlD